MFAAFLLACCFAAPAEVTIDADTISLGALIPFPSSDPRAVISLGYAPKPGLARRIARYEISGKIAAAGHSTDDLQLPDSILVRRQAASLDRDQVTRAVLDAFMRHYPDANIEITSLEIPPVQIGTGALEIAATLPARFDLTNAVFVKVDIRGTSFTRTVFARTKVKVEGAAGTQAPVQQVTVRKGDSVTVRAVSGGVTIAATMRAKASGKLGDTIPVEHLSGEGSTTARIAGPGVLQTFQVAK